MRARYIVNESANVLPTGKQRALPDSRSFIQNGLVNITKRPHRERWLCPCGPENRRTQLAIIEASKATIGMLYQHHFPRTEYYLRNGQGTDDVVGHGCARIANDMRIALD